MRIPFLVLLACMLAACATPPPPAPIVEVTPIKVEPPPPPVKTTDAQASERLVNAWLAFGLKTEAVYVQVPDKPADRIEWKSFYVNLPADAKAADGVLRSVGQFVASAKQPVRVGLYARTAKQDKQLSAALKQGAIESGGRNSVKLDHNIASNLQPKVEVMIREGQ